MRRRVPRATAWLVALAFALPWAAPARAQAPDRPGSIPPDRAGTYPAIYPAPAGDEALFPAALFDEAPEAPYDPPASDSACPPEVSMGPLAVMYESIFGPASKADWKPMTLSTFFTEGWDQPFVNAPEGTNGAPKQNWIGAPSGVFLRIATLDFFYTNHLNNVPGLLLTPNADFMPVHTFTTGNQYAGYATILLPLNARMEIQLGTVFIDSRKSSPAGGYVGNWGDTDVQARFHLVEQRNFSLVGIIAERIPTGKSVNGSDINYVTPGLEFWWNFAPQWVVRGGTAININTGRRSATSVYVNQLAVGRYLTTKDARIFKELEVHVTASVLSDLSGGAGFVDNVWIFPGFRFGLDKGRKWYVLGGVNVPVSGPQPYAWQPQFALIRNY